MTGRLIYIVGPSGAGKDALVDYARAHLSEKDRPRVRFAQRWITRPAGSIGEDHQSLSREEFGAMLAAKRFAMAWHAHGNDYGIGTEIADWLRAGKIVVVNGSREYLPQALKDYPRMTVVSVTVSPMVLKDRLERRGRESHQDIERRLARAEQFTLPADIAAVQIRNDLSLEDAGEAMLAAIVGD